MVPVFVNAGLCPNAKKHLTSKFTCKKRRKEQGGGEDQKVNKRLFCFSILAMSRSHGCSKQLPATCTCHRCIKLLILGAARSESLSLTKIFTFDTRGIMGTSLRDPALLWCDVLFNLSCNFFYW